LNGVVVFAPGGAFGPLFAHAGYLVCIAPPVGSIDDIAAELLEMRQLTPGAIAALAIGAPTALLLEAATMLPQLDALVLIEPQFPAATRPHYTRMRAQIQLHRTGGSNPDVAHLRDEAARAQIQIFDWDDYATGSDTRDDIAWDRIRDFLATALPVIEAI